MAQENPHSTVQSVFGGEETVGMMKSGNKRIRQTAIVSTTH